VISTVEGCIAGAIVAKLSSEDWAIRARAGVPQTIVKGYKALLAEANAAIRTLSVEEAVALVGRDDVTFVDLRDPRELEREGKMPGAFHCPRGLLEFWIDPESPYAKPVFQQDKMFVFFCAGGWRSALAAKTAQDMGLKPVAHIEGGFGAWRKADGPIIAPADGEGKTT
jgi:rhodanese-related sulfurtransferase